MTEIKMKTRLNKSEFYDDSIFLKINHNKTNQIEIMDSSCDIISLKTENFEKLIEIYINMKYKSKNNFSDDPNFIITIEEDINE